MSAQPEKFDVIILGAGAAGLMCALNAGGRGRRVLLIERNQNPGEKIRISGGGRCNFTNLDMRPERFLSNNPHFAKSALSQYDQFDFIALIERHAIAYHEKILGQLFCDGTSRQVIDMLLGECKLGRVDLRCAQNVKSVSHDGAYIVETDKGCFTSPSLVLATGGRSIPKMGATGFSYDIAAQFGLDMIRPRPGLVPLIVSREALGFDSELSGISLVARVHFEETRFEESILFTHKGLSGPAILQISSYWRDGEAIIIDLAPGRDISAFLVEAKRSRAKQLPKSVLGDILPQRLADAFAEKHLPKEQMANIPDRDLEAIGRLINGWEIKPSSSEGWVKAEVTCGGVDTDGLSSKTMQARDVPGLYVIGEAVDVTGWLGGYNFQWAWSSGWCAGQVV